MARDSGNKTHSDSQVDGGPERRAHSTARAQRRLQEQQEKRRRSGARKKKAREHTPVQPADR